MSMRCRLKTLCRRPPEKLSPVPRRNTPASAARQAEQQVETEQTAEHQHDARDDHQVNRCPGIAVGDHPRHPWRIIKWRNGMDQVADHPGEARRWLRHPPAGRATAAY